MKNKWECCKVKKCERPVSIQKHNLCNAHYQRLLRGESVTSKPLRPRRVLPIYQHVD